MNAFRLGAIRSHLPPRSARPAFFRLISAALVSGGLALGQTGPFDGQTFRGRIAYSADGNHNDPDDWASSPIALALIDAFDLKDQLVHFNFNCILNNNDPEWARQHRIGVLGAAVRFGYDERRFFDCERQLDETIADIARIVNESSEDDPLYFVIAGPMEIVYRGLQRADPEKRRFVYCLSHSRWNDGYSPRYVYRNTKRDVIEQGVKWVQVFDQRNLSTSPYGRKPHLEEWTPYVWLRDAFDPKLIFLWERLVASGRPDCSDSGMVYFLLSGKLQPLPLDYRRLLLEGVRPEPIQARPLTRLEAENFQRLEGYEVENITQGERDVSHRLAVKLSSAGSGRIETVFDEPYTAIDADYHVVVRHFDAAGTANRYTLLVNGKAVGQSWSSSDGVWTARRVAQARIRTGDRIEVRVDNRGTSRLDYVDLELISARP